MFIELTDHLRCPADHEEQFLVLIPDVMDQRSVISGKLGCPVCHREFLVEEGVADLRLPAPGSRLPSRLPPADHPPLPGGEGTLALLGLSGPGGYILLAGTAALAAPALLELEPGVHVIALNPPEPLDAMPMLSVLQADMIPLKQRSLRGVILGAEEGGDERWIREAVRTVLPGLRIVGAGPAPETQSLSVLAEAGGWWVGVKG